MKAASFRGVALAALVAAFAYAWQREANEVLLDGFDQFTLPGFDAYVYMAMAERPSVFTLSPWGYRILTPWLVRLLPLPTADGFRAVTALGLSAAGGLLYLFLRRLGHGEKASLLAVAAFGLSAPFGASVACPFLVEPLSLALLLALLAALEAGAGAAVLSPLAALCALSKEVTLLFLPVIFFARRDRDGARRALATTLLALLPAAAVTLVLRLWWAPVPDAARESGGDVWLALWRIVERTPDWWRFAFLGGVLPLAALGAVRRRSRPFLLRYGYLLAAAWALPFVASVYTGDVTVPFFGDDIPRLLIYALPLLLPLALAALDRAVPHIGPAPLPARYGSHAALAGAALAAAVAAFPLLAQDRYRRADLQGPRDGRFVLALVRESLDVADRLAHGRAYAYDPEARSFVPRKTLPSLMGRMRWFLREGWGPHPQYATGPPAMAATEATLLLPCLEPADLTLGLTMSARGPARLAVSLGHRVLGELRLGAASSRQSLEIPAAALLRGDNLLRLSADRPGSRLHQLVVRPRQP